MKKRVFVLLFLAGLGLMLSGCAMKAEDAGIYEHMEENEYSVDDTTPDEPAPVTEDAEINGGDVTLESSIPALEDRKIIYTANLVMEDPEPSEVYEDIVALLDEHTAYVESANIVGDSSLEMLSNHKIGFSDGGFMCDGMIEELHLCIVLLSFMRLP